MGLWTRKAIPLNRRYVTWSKKSQKNKIYKFNCKDCKSWYIGEIGQKVENRTYQHKNDVRNGKETNAIFMHLQGNNNHSIEWEASYLDRAEDWKKRKIKEALYINSMDPKKLMNLEKGFEINQCWNEFNPQIRNIALRKGKWQTEFSRAYASQNLHFHSTVGDHCVSIESDRRDSWWRHQCSVET